MKQRADSYFGFAQRKGSLFAGVRLEEKLEREKISLLIFLPNCPEKVYRHLEELADLNPESVILDYTGSYDVAFASGFEKVNAVGISDVHLAEAIYDTLLSEKKDETVHSVKEETK